MARIALVNIGMHGHVNPTLGFTRELVSRGHEVHFFSTPEFKASISATGAQFVPYSSTMGAMTAEHARAQAEATEKGIAPPTQVSAMTRFLKEFESTFGELFAAIQSISPDILVYDFASYAPKLIADHLGIKAIKFFTTYASNEKH